MASWNDLFFQIKKKNINQTESVKAVERKASIRRKKKFRRRQKVKQQRQKQLAMNQTVVEVLA